MDAIKKSLPSVYLSKVLEKESERRPALEESAQAVDRFVTQHPREASTIGALEVHSHKMAEQHRAKARGSGFGAGACLMGLFASAMVAATVECMPIFLVPAIPFLAGTAALSIRETKQDQLADSAETAHEAALRFSGKALRLEESAHYLQAYGELEGETPSLLPADWAAEGLVDLTRRVGSDKATELWPIAQNYVNHYEREEIFARLALAEQHTVGEPLSQLWHKLPQEDPQLPQRLKLAASLATTLEGKSSEILQRLKSLPDPRAANKIVEEIKEGLQFGLKGISSYPAIFDDSKELQIPPGLKSPTLQVRANSNKYFKLYRDQEELHCWGEGQDFNPKKSGQWYEIKLPEDSRGLAIGGKGGKVCVFEAKLRGEGLNGLTEETAQRLMKVFESPEGLPRLQQFHQASGDWMGALKLWETWNNYCPGLPEPT